MKKFVLAGLGAVAAMVATPAMADTFQGPRVEVTAGVDDVINGFDTTDVTYGVGVGYDHQFGRVVLGVEASADNVFDRRDLSVGARVGYAVTDSILVYGTAGYANWKQFTNVELEGLRVGGGLEFNVVGPVYAKVQYTYTDFEANTGKHGVKTGVGLRF